MIRLLNAYFPKRTLALGISEACLVGFAFIAAAVARLGSSDASILLRPPQGASKILAVSVVFFICMYYFDLYDPSVLGNRREVLVRLIQVIGTVYAVLAVLYFLCPPLELGRGIFQIGFVFVAILLVFWRSLFSLVNSRSQFAERALLIGDGPLAEPLLHEFESRPELGIRVVGRNLTAINYDRSYREGGKTIGEEMYSELKTLRINRIVIAMDDCRGKLPVEVLLSLKSHGVQVLEGTEVYEAITGKVPIEAVRLSRLLFSPGCYASRFFLAYKRFASVVVSILGMLATLPVLPFVMLAIKVSSPGPILYRQKRVGRDSVIFHCYKFRTMRADAEADTGPTWATDDDPRITRVGRFMRRSRLDEIPQLWNVFKGDMSIVGPRPERPEFVRALTQQIPHYQLRHGVRPGITGWAQIRYRYGSSVEDAKEKLRYDLFYIKNMSTGLDVLVFLETVKVVLLGRGSR